MAHQCLQCGRAFPDGSPELLRGCPACGGTRFFYTQAPLARQGREALLREANRDLRQILEELVRARERPDFEAPVWSPEARERWLRVDAARLRAGEEGAVEEVAGPAEAAPRQPWPQAPRTRAAQQATLPLAPLAPLAPAAPEPGPGPSPPAAEPAGPEPHAAAGGGPPEPRPEVVVVQEPGRYEIDVEHLLEKSPIVVRRDGVYVIHLPSVFANAAQR